MEKILVPGGRLELNEIISDKTKKANTYLSQIYDIDEKELCDKLAQIDYKYDETVNQFK